MVHNNKNEAIRLRKDGKSYREISNVTGVPKGTLSGWFAGLVWSENISERNAKQSIEKSKVRLEKMNSARRVVLASRYLDAQKEAGRDFKLYKNDNKFVAGLMVYLGTGDKTLDSNLVRISNVDPIVLKIFIQFLIVFCEVPIEKIKFWVLLYPDLDEDTCKKYWMKELGLTQSNLYKFQVVEGRHTKKKLRYGVGNTILGNKFLKVKLLEWIRLSGLELTK